MQSAEIELKFPVPDVPALESRLPALGFLLETPRTFENNTLYDTPDRQLRAKRQLLRIRRYGDIWTVTHKRLSGSPAEQDSSRYKIRVETETTLADGAMLAAIFEQLGFAPAFTYQKFRTEWSQSLDSPGSPLAHLVIDETPIGNFAELEGPTSWIDQTLNTLKIDPSVCLTDSYGKLFLDWKARTGSPADNLTFDEIQSPVAASR